MLPAVDLFCGAGGTTTGAHMSGQVKVKVAVNHWQPAVYSHSANHPETRHICAEIDRIDPRDFVDYGIQVLFASPECIFHSNARGGRPVDDQRRATAWCVPRWAEILRPKWIVIENVREFADWGPLGVDNRPLKSKRGEIFAAWINAIRALGYHVEWKNLNAADYGGATKRLRLFVVARRGRSRQPIPWPAATHSKESWTPAWTVIDWSRPFPSIFNRKRPLAPKTLKRIEIGIKKFAEPFIVNMRRNGNAGSARDPLNTVTAGGNHFGLATPFFVQYHGGRNPRRDGTDRQYSLLDPLPTVDTQNRYAIAAPFLYRMTGRGVGRSLDVEKPLPTIVAAYNGYGVVTPFILPRPGFYGPSEEKRPWSIDEPLPTITASHGGGHVAVPFMVDVNHGDKGRSPGGRMHGVGAPLNSVTTHRGQAAVLPFVTEYYGTGGARGVDEPLSTVTTKHRHGVALVRLMQELGIYDIGFRMLDVDELAMAQGFPAGYQLIGTKGEQIKQVGNSVHTLVAKAICEAIGKAG